MLCPIKRRRALEFRDGRLAAGCISSSICEMGQGNGGVAGSCFAGDDCLVCGECERGGRLRRIASLHWRHRLRSPVLAETQRNSLELPSSREGRLTPSLGRVCEQEGLPPVDGYAQLLPGEQRVLQSLGVIDYVERISQNRRTRRQEGQAQANREEFDLKS